MNRFRNGNLGIERGERVLFSDFEDGGKMWVDKGPRESRQRIKFTSDFVGPPIVHVGIVMWDIDQKSNQRADILAEKVDADGFDLVFRTWGDTQVARVRAAWLVIGQLPDDEIWELY